MATNNHEHSQNDDVFVPDYPTSSPTLHRLEQGGAVKHKSWAIEKKKRFSSIARQNSMFGKNMSLAVFTSGGDSQGLTPAM